jgi:outer membrane protein
MLLAARCLLCACLAAGAGGSQDAAVPQDAAAASAPQASANNGVATAPSASDAGAPWETISRPDSQAPPQQETPAHDSATATPAISDAAEAEATVEPAPGVRTVSLDEAVTMALQGNFGLLASADAVYSARIAEGVQRAEFFPKVTPLFQRSPDQTTIGASMDENLPWTGGLLHASFGASSPHDSQSAHTSALNVTLVQPLLRGFGPAASLFALRNARRAREGQERGFVLARQGLIVQVTSAFYQVVRQRQLVEVARQSLKRSANLKKASQARMLVGMVSKLDVFRAEIQAAQAGESVVAAESGLDTALESFRVLLGLPPRTPIEPESVRLDAEASLEIEPVDVLTVRAIEHRLELKEGRDRVQDARRALASARQSLLPTLDVNVVMSQTGVGATLADSLRAVDRRVGVTLSAGLPLQRAADRAQQSTGELNLKAAERNLRQMEMQVEAEVRAAARRIDSLSKSIELQRQGVTLAQQQQRLATLRYQRGLASNFDVVDAEGNLVAARTALVGLLSNLAVARVELLRAVGVLDAPSEEPR